MSCIFSHRVTSVVVGALIGAVLTVIGPAFAQDMPKAAQAPFERGIAAARQNEWALAIKYFKEAEEKARTDKRILFNLAVALDRAGGNELGAIARYRAFLVGSPQGPQADATRKRIEALEIRVEANALRLIEKAKQAAAALPKEYERESATATIAENLARIGNIAAAKQLAGTVKNRDHAYRLIAEAQARNGDFSGAKSTAGAVSKEATKAATLITIASEQAKAGHLDAARATARSIVPLLEQADAYIAVADAMVKAKRNADALSALAAARSAIDRAKADASQRLRYARMVPLLAAAGDLTAAEQVAPLGAKDESSFNSAYRDLVTGLAKAGQIERARHYLPKIANKDYKKWAERDIASALEKNLKAAVKEGRLSDALKLASISGQPADRLVELADALQKKGDRAQALTILRRARKTASGYTLSSIASHQLALGDIAAAKETASLAKDDTAANSWRNIAKRQLETGDTNGAKISLASALEAIKTMKGSDLLSTAYEVVQQYVALGDTKGARRVADLMPKTSSPTFDYRDHAYRHIAAAELKRGAITDAIAAAASIPNDDTRGKLLVDIVEKQTKTGQIESATVTAGRIADSKWRGRALARLMSHYQSVGRWKDAEAAFSAIDSVSEQATTWGAQASFFYYRGALVRSRTPLAKALDAADKIEPVGKQLDAFRYIANYAQSLGDLDARSRAIAGARKLIAQIEKDGARDSARKTIADLLSSHLARALIEQIESDKSRADAYRDFARRLHRDGDNASALAILQRAVAVARSLPEARDTLYEIGYNISRLSEIGEFDAALALVGTVSDAAKQEELLANIAGQAASAKRPEAVAPSLQELGPKYAGRKAAVFVATADKQLANGSKPAAALMIGHALKVTRAIEDSNTRAELLLEIANLQIKVGDRSGSEATIADARQLLPLIYDYQRRARASQLAKIYTASNRWKMAQKLAREEKIVSVRDSTLQTIATDLRESKEFDAAAEVISDIHDDAAKDSAYASLSNSMSAAKEFDAAQKIVARIKDRYRIASSSYSLALTLIRNNKVAAATKAAAAIRSNIDKVEPQHKETLRSWDAQVSARLGRVDEARAQAEQLTAISSREYAYQAIAGANLMNGDAAGALETLRTARKSTGLSDPGDGWARWKLSNLLWQQKDHAGSEAEAARIGDPLMRSGAMKDVANGFVADKNYAGALAAAAKIPDSGYRTVALQTIVDAADKVGDVESTLAAAAAIPLPELRDQALGRVARNLANKGQIDTAAAQARKIADPAARAFTFNAIALAAIKLGRPDEARAPLAEAIDAARNISDHYLAALAFADAGYTYLDAGDRASAQKVLAFDERLAHGISNASLRKAALRRLLGERKTNTLKTDPLVKKEIDDRVSFIHGYVFRNNTVYSDFRAFLGKVASEKNPSNAVSMLARAASDLDAMAKRLRRMDEDWQRRRETAAHAPKAK